MEVLRSCDPPRQADTGRLRSQVSCASRAGRSGRCKPGGERSDGHGLGRAGYLEWRIHDVSPFAYTQALGIAKRCPGAAGAVVNRQDPKFAKELSRPDLFASLANWR